MAEERPHLIDAVVSLAGQGGQAAVFDVLANASDLEAATLADQYFVRYPLPAVLDNLRARVQGRYREKRGLALPLAAMGDEGVLHWALSHIDDELPLSNEGLAWLPTYIVASSPRAEARPVASRLLDKGGTRARWIAEARKRGLF